MNSEDNGEAPRPISRFSRASRDSISSQTPAPAQSQNASAPQQERQNDPFSWATWPGSPAPSLHPAGSFHVGARAPVFTSTNDPSVNPGRVAPRFGDFEAPQPTGTVPSEIAPPSHLSAGQLPRLEDEPATPQNFQAAGPGPSTQHIDVVTPLPDFLRRQPTAPLPGVSPAANRFHLEQPHQPSAPSTPQTEFSVQAPPNQEEAQPAAHASEPAPEAERPTGGPAFSISRYIPQQARELSNLISRFSLKRNHAASDASEGAERKPFALVPYLPPQARGFAALLTRLRLKLDRSEAAARTSKFMQYARTESARIAAKSAQAAARSAQKSAKGLTKARQEIAHNLQPQELKRNYQRMLERAHDRFVDRKLDPLFFVPTHTPGQQLAAVSGPGPAPAGPSGGPAPQLVFDWALTALPQDLREFAFVDFCAGRGRNLMLAARRNFEKIIGYEFDDQIYDDLLMNVAQFPRSRMVCRNIECLRGDRQGIDIPNQPAVLFFSDAQRDELLPSVLEQAVASHRINPRSIYVIMFHPGLALPPGVAETFRPVPMALIDRLKLTALSPVKVAVYCASP